VAGIQDLLDDIAQEVGAGVSLDDLGGRLVGYSAQGGRADEARVRAVLERRSPDDVRAWQSAHGAGTATRPVVIPPNEGLGMSARVCVPLLHRGVRTGLLFLIGDDADPQAVADRVGEQVAALAALLYEDAAPEGRVRDADLLAACRGSQEALTRLREALGPAADRPLRVVLHQRAGFGSAQERVVAQQVVAAARVVAGAVAPAYVVALVGEGADPAELVARLDEQGSGTTGTSLLADLDDLPSATGRALVAAQAAAVDEALGRVADWDELGIYRLLTHVDEEAAGSPMLERVLAQHHGETLARTLEVVLDEPGGVTDAAGMLHVHRTSLYYRLGRLRDLLGTDPLVGQVRTELHLALKLRRWERRPRVRLG
jgi:hypothetical protein